MTLSGSPSDTRETQWRAVEAAARAQVSAELLREEAYLPAVGSLVAWAETGWMGTTDGFSRVHRVAAAVQGQAMTLCSETVPPPKRRVAHLTPDLVETLGRCRYCERINAGHAVAALQLSTAVLMRSVE